MSVSSCQRWTRDRRCPVCCGCAYDPRGQGVRCEGYRSADSRYARCARPERAGAIPPGPDGLFPHRLGGSCACGLDHGGAVAVEAPLLKSVALGRPLDTVPAPLIPPVAMWLERSRGLSVAEIGSMRALMTGLGPAVVFEYLRSVRSVQAVKVWPIDQKDRMFRSPVGAGALPLYGWERLEDVTADVASVVEGELDMHALRSVGIELVVSVPDGARTRITPALLAPLARFRRVVVAVDADQEGDGLAHRLGEALGSGRCRRVRFGQHKDANEALLAGWGREEFRRVLAGAAAEGA